MKLISADALNLKSLHNAMWNEKIVFRSDVQRMIDEAPAIETGMLTFDTMEHIVNFTTPRIPVDGEDCPNCGSSVIIRDYNGMEDYNAEFCPVCGQAIKWRDEE